MTSLASKTRALVLGNLHALLNRAIDANSIPVLEQYLRDLGNANADLADAAAGAQTDVSMTQGKINLILTKQTETQHNLDLILMDDDTANDETLGVPLQARIQAFDQQLISLREQLEGEQETAQSLATAAQQLSMKYQTMADDLNRLRSLEKKAAGEERAAEAITSAAAVAGTDAADRVDSVEERLRRREGIADARLKRAMGGLTDAVDVGVVTVQAKDAIAKRRAELAAKKSATTAS